MNQLFNTVKYSRFQTFWRVSRINETASPCVSYEARGSNRAEAFAQHGDPLDALVLMDERAFVGCLVESRVVGVIEANRTEDGKTGEMIASSLWRRNHTPIGTSNR